MERCCGQDKIIRIKGGDKSQNFDPHYIVNR